MESVMQNMQSEIAELHKIIKQQSEKITYNETMMAHLVTYVHSTHVAATAKPTADEDADSSDDDVLSEDEEEDDEEDDDEDDEDANLCVNPGYETRLGDLERFVLNLEQKILELEKRQQKL
jgi:hypothetical protein